MRHERNCRYCTSAADAGCSEAASDVAAVSALGSSLAAAAAAAACSSPARCDNTVMYSTHAAKTLFEEEGTRGCGNTHTAKEVLLAVSRPAARCVLRSEALGLPLYTGSIG